MDKISVIVPVYNAQDTVENCIKSLLEQDFSGYEILLVDDGSTDRSGEICDRIEKECASTGPHKVQTATGGAAKGGLRRGMETDAGGGGRFSGADGRPLPAVHVYHTENRGAAAARNYGIRKAGGQYIAFVDSDDTVAPDYLSYLWRLAAEHEADIAVCGFQKVYEGSKGTEEKRGNADKTVSREKKGNADKKDGICEGENRPAAEKEYVRLCPGRKAVESLLYQRDFLSVPWGMISHRKLWNKVSFPEGTKAEDMGTIYRLFAESRMTVYGSRKAYLYYQRADNTMFSTSSERNVDYYKHSREMVRYVKENMPELLPAARSRHFSACFQILSETERRPENKMLLWKVYHDIRRIRKAVFLDKNAKLRNRIAAALAKVSVRMLHKVLRKYYQMQKKRLSDAG